jgi:hypothetical protein
VASVGAGPVRVRPLFAFGVPLSGDLE